MGLGAVTARFPWNSGPAQPAESPGPAKLTSRPDCIREEGSTAFDGWKLRRQQTRTLEARTAVCHSLHRDEGVFRTLTLNGTRV